MTADGVWRDEDKLPLDELTRAVATSPVDGQGDDIDADLHDDQARSEDLRSDDGRAVHTRSDFSGRMGPNAPV